nr:hypothetical protein [Sicyoidochytrium minutum DNA virus]
MKILLEQFGKLLEKVVSTF